MTRAIVSYNEGKRPGGIAVQKTRALRYVLFSLLFALVLVGIVVHNYIALASLMVCGIILAIVSDFIETAPTRPYKQYNHMHDRHGDGPHLNT